MTGRYDDDEPEIDDDDDGKVQRKKRQNSSQIDLSLYNNTKENNNRDSVLAPAFGGGILGNGSGKMNIN